MIYFNYIIDIYNKDIKKINIKYENEDDFIYYTNENNETKSGGFTLNSLGLKNGLSPFSGGGGTSWRPRDLPWSGCGSHLP